MNTGNAFGFVGLGLSMWLMPMVAPAWFPHVAIDGSSTRELWAQIMGIMQFGLGVSFLARRGFIAIKAQAESLLARRGSIATAEWQTDGWPHSVVSVELASANPARPIREGVAVYARQAALRRMVERAFATEARITAFLARAARRRLAVRVGGLGTYAGRPEAEVESMYELLSEELRHVDELQEVA